MKQIRTQLCVDSYILLILISVFFPSVYSVKAASKAKPTLFEASEKSIDYLTNKTQFQLHTLLTEQRHPKTLNLSYEIKKDPESALRMLLAVDEDVSDRMDSLAARPNVIGKMSDAFLKAIEEGKRIYFYGCGSTGRLAIQMESAFWRPFWQKVASKFPQFAGMTERVVGEITGGDRALVASLPGFEDLQLIGKLQLRDHKINKGDVVVAITEGGETSSVIGTILEAASNYKKSSSNPDRELNESQKHLFFVYNNPDELLNRLDRSQSVLTDSFITKLPLYTGPQGIAGSTRLQATTSEIFAVGMALEHAVSRYLSSRLTQAELKTVGFIKTRSISERLKEFRPIQKMLSKRSHQLAHLTLLEAQTYESQHHSYYIANNAMVAVFIDATERAPTFRLFPLDRSDSIDRKSLIQVWSPARSGAEAWLEILKRPFRGLKSEIYQKPFESEISDSNLREEALRSLAIAGDQEQNYYDLSFSERNQKTRGPMTGDLAVFVLLSEKEEAFKDKLKYFQDSNVRTAILSSHLGRWATSKIKADYHVDLPLLQPEDPMGIRQNVAIKMALNAHSTATMARLGKVVGNTMTSVNPGNLKLIGRATFLIQSHVNEVVAKSHWKNIWTSLYSNSELSYENANAALFNAMDYVEKTGQVGKISEVALSIIRILEPLRSNGKPVTWDSARDIIQNHPLQEYLEEFNSISESSIHKNKDI